MRRGFTVAAVLASFVAGGENTSHAQVIEPSMSTAKAVQRLLDGNRRFVHGQSNTCDQKGPGAPVGGTIGGSSGENPFAIVLACSDMVISPEVMFDEAPGGLFVIRVAGQVADKAVLGTVEQLAARIDSPLIIVLGHEGCDVISTVAQAKRTPPGNLGVLFRNIKPAVKKASLKEQTPTELVEAAMLENVRLVAEQLTQKSRVLKKLVTAGRLQIVPARYDSDNGRVTLLDPELTPTTASKLPERPRN